MGILACNDGIGLRVLEACRRAAVLVPEEVAVLGVDNDEPLCEIAHPMLSSIVPVHDRVGYAAAALLDRLMAGERTPRTPQYLQPSRIVVRRSSDVLAMEDHDVAEAVRFIREAACSGIGVDDVVRRVQLSYSTLKRRFHAVLGRSIHDEIVRVRLQRACDLLAETELPLPKIAERTGFRHAEYLGAVFKAKLGMTALRYRQQAAPAAEGDEQA